MTPSATVTIVPAPLFSLLSYAIVVDALRVANREAGAAVFRRQTVAAISGPVRSSSGVDIETEAAMETVRSTDIVVVLGAYDVEAATRPDLLSWLRKHHRNGAVVVGVDTGPYILGRAGLLNGRRIAAHREAMAAYQEAFTDVTAADGLNVIDGRIGTSAGAMATLDIVLELIATAVSRDLAGRVAHVMNHKPLDPQAARGLVWSIPDRLDRRLARLLELMRAHVETPLSIADLCAQASVDLSTARRLFLARFATSPGRHYRNMRLDHGRHLLANSVVPIGEIAVMTGFSGPSTFSRAFADRFGVSPSQARRADPGAVS